MNKQEPRPFSYLWGKKRGRRWTDKTRQGTHRRDYVYSLPPSNIGGLGKWESSYEGEKTYLSKLDASPNARSKTTANDSRRIPPRQVLQGEIFLASNCRQRKWGVQEWDNKKSPPPISSRPGVRMCGVKYRRLTIVCFHFGAEPSILFRRVGHPKHKKAKPKMFAAHLRHSPE